MWECDGDDAVKARGEQISHHQVEMPGGMSVEGTVAESFSGGFTSPEREAAGWRAS
jgi:hypothetical protein